MRLEWEKEEKGSRKAFEENKEERHKERCASYSADKE